MNPIIEALREFGEISTEIAQEMERMTQVVQKKKGSFILKAGQQKCPIFVMEKGAVRISVKNKEKLNVVWFGFEKDVILSTRPFFRSLPAVEYIEFLEDSTVYFIPQDDFYTLYDCFPEMNKLMRNFIEEVTLLVEERANYLHALDATERYKYLLETFPDLTQRVSLSDIASFLGINLSTLSRIRASILTNVK